MRANQFLLIACLALLCATRMSAQEDLYGRIKPLEAAMSSGSQLGAPRGRTIEVKAFMRTLFVEQGRETDQ